MRIFIKKIYVDIDNYFALCYNVYMSMPKKWGTFQITSENQIDGECVPDGLWEAVTREQSRAMDFEAFRKRVSVRASCFELYDEENGKRAYSSFDAFITALGEYKYDYLFTFDSVRAFSFIDALTLSDSKWKVYHDRKGQIDEKRKYKKVKGFGRYELTGEYGQRYMLTLWAPYKGTREKGGDRHERTHGTDLYGFRNVFNSRFEDVRKDFNISDDVDDVIALYRIISQFSVMCESLFNAAYIQPKKPLAMTAGSLSKRDILREMYGNDNYVSNIRAFKRCHPITAKQYAFFKKVHLMRGGIVCNNPAYLNKPLNGVYKYDVNSEYSTVVRDMADLGKVESVDPKEMEHPKEGYSYIYVFDLLRLRAREGFPAVFTCPFTGRNSRKLTIPFRFGIFGEELEMLKKFYHFGESILFCLLRVKKGENDGYKRYVDKWYNRKREAKEKHESALYMFSKIMNNAPWGKFSQRKIFPECTHYTDANGLIRLEKHDPEEEADQNDRGALSIVQGAYITMLGRCYIMQRILDICGCRPLDNFIATDTDSIHTFQKAPPAIVDALELGKMKLEGHYIESKYLDKKCYYNMESVSPLKVDLHCRGISASAIVFAICDNYDINELSEAPREALSAAFSDGMIYATPILCIVKGGRCVLYQDKQITTKARSKSSNGANITGYNGELIEI